MAITTGRVDDVTTGSAPHPGNGVSAPGSTAVRSRLLIVDDHPAVREGLRSMLGPEPDMEVVAEAADGREALHQAELARPDVVLMDIFMPGMGGIEATRAIKARWPHIRVVMFTALRTRSLVRLALAAGADGYLLKDIPRHHLVSAIRTVAGGSIVIRGELWQSLLLTSSKRTKPPPGGMPSSR